MSFEGSTDGMQDPPPVERPTPLWYGVYSARVSDIKDPMGQGRVKVELTSSPEPAVGPHEAWARLATMMAGRNRGSWFVPDVEDEVLVAFDGGDIRHPYVIGAFWSARDMPPESMDAAGNNYKKVLRSRNGLTVTLNDTDGQEQLNLETPGGQKIVLKDGPGRIEITDSNGNSVTLESSGVAVSCPAKVTVSASSVTISAGMVTIDAGISKFSGVVQADTVITNSVISAFYSPGVGNIS